MDQRPWCPRLLFFPSTKKVSLQYFCQSISLSEITVTLLLGDGWAVWQHFYKVWMGWRTEQGQMRDVGGGGGRKAMLIHAPSNTFQTVKSLTTCFFHDNTLVSACMLKLFSPSTKNWLHNIPEPSQSECEPSQNHSIHPVCVHCGRRHEGWPVSVRSAGPMCNIMYRVCLGCIQRQMLS